MATRLLELDLELDESRAGLVGTGKAYLREWGRALGVPCLRPLGCLEARVSHSVSFFRAAPLSGLSAASLIAAPQSLRDRVCETDECETEAVSGQGTGQGTARARVKMYSRGEKAESVDCASPRKRERGRY